MGQPLVSVVLTNHNGEAYIRQSVESVLAQTYPAWELIIVDDASDDGSPEFIRSLRDPRIRAVFNEENGQVSYTHNRGNRLCRGTYIAALDYDDLWKPDKLEKQVAYMEAHPETGVCFSLLDLIDEHGDPLRDPGTEAIYEIDNMSREAWLHLLMTDGNHLANDSSLIRRSVMEEIGENDLTMLQLHDYDMWVKIPQRHEMYVLQEPLMSYRKERNSESITAKTEQNTRRTFFEFAWIIGENILGMEEGLFRRVFRTELVCPALTGPDALACEKAILLASDRLVTNCRVFAFYLFQQLLAREETRMLLREQFHITQHEVYRMTGEPIFHDAQDRRNQIQLEEARRRIRWHEEEIQAYLATIEEYKASFSWRITAPVRAVSGRVKELAPLLRRTKTLMSGGPKAACRRIWGRLRRPGLNRAILAGMRRTPEELEAQRQTRFPREILISVLVPLYNTPEAFLREMIDSVRQQTYGRWELCLADGSDAAHPEVERVCAEIAKEDPRIRYRRLKENGGISENTNACLEMATGDYIALFDHDDLLHPSAFYEVMRAICGQGADYVYTDEVVFASPDRNRLIANHFKPDFSPDNLLANNYICHLSVFARALVERGGAFRRAYDGSQDHDLILRLTNEAKKVVHVPKALYLWRSHPASVASDISSKTYAVDAGRNAVKDFLRERQGIEARVSSVPAYPTLYHVEYEMRFLPPVEVIIDLGSGEADPGRLQAELERITGYAPFHLTFVCPEGIRGPEGREATVIHSAAKGRAARLAEAARGTESGMLLFLSPELEVLTPGWMREMAVLASLKHRGAVGARILFPDTRTVRHAGLILGLGERGLIGRSHEGISAGNSGYFGQLAVAEDVSAVSCECMMVSRENYLAVGGFDTGYQDALFDADFCLKLREKGLYNVYTPFAELSGGDSRRFSLDFGPEWASYDADAARFRQRWGEAIEKGDPFYNPNLSLRHEDFRVRTE